MNNKHIYIGGPADGVRTEVVIDGQPKELDSIRRDGTLYRFNGVVNHDGYREMMCEEVG
jgi:hypothetical protein